jgi:hypothetical protein
LLFSFSSQIVFAQTESPVSASAPNPEYDRIIAEALKAGKDPVDYAMGLKNGGKMTFTQQRSFNKYY